MYRPVRARSNRIPPYGCRTHCSDRDARALGGGNIFSRRARMDHALAQCRSLPVDLEDNDSHRWKNERQVSQVTTRTPLDLPNWTDDCLTRPAIVAVFIAQRFLSHRSSRSGSPPCPAGLGKMWARRFGKHLGDVGASRSQRLWERNVVPSPSRRTISTQPLTNFCVRTALMY